MICVASQDPMQPLKPASVNSACEFSISTKVSYMHFEYAVRSIRLASSRTPCDSNKDVIGRCSIEEATFQTRLRMDPTSRPEPLGSIPDTSGKHIAKKVAMNIAHSPQYPPICSFFPTFTVQLLPVKVDPNFYLFPRGKS